MAEKIRIGIAGFGTVGSGVAKIILENANAIEERTGMRLEIACIVDIDTTTKRPVDLPEGMLTDDINALLNDDSIDIAIELIGGTTTARQLMIDMLNSGKHVVTANKALLAEHGCELNEVARKNGKCIAFEASCAGGIPLISSIRTGLAANNIQAMYGILNGTSNYILTNMTAHGSSFEEVLEEAQQKGYAEADPTLDINGGDSAHKLTILSSIAFGCDIKLEDIHIEGIESIKQEDIKYGVEMGYILKLLAIAEKEKNGKISLRVHPAFVLNENPIARVEGPFNAVSIFGDAVGQTMYYGRGAGMMPTASAVIADTIDVAMGHSLKLFNAQKTEPREKTQAKLESINNVVSRYYIRLSAKDIPGTVAVYARVLGDNGIGLSGILQHEKHDEGKPVRVIVTTHPCPQSSINAALKEIEKLDVIYGKPVCIRVIDIPEDEID